MYTIIPICVHNKTWPEKHNFSKNIYRDGSRTPTSSQMLHPVTLVKRLKAVRKELRRVQLRCCRVR